jgi:hypothetical protein
LIKFENKPENKGPTQQVPKKSLEVGLTLAGPDDFKSIDGYQLLDVSSDFPIEIEEVPQEKIKIDCQDFSDLSMKESQRLNWTKKDDKLPSYMRG